MSNHKRGAQERKDAWAVGKILRETNPELFEKLLQEFKEQEKAKLEEQLLNVR